MKQILQKELTNLHHFLEASNGITHELKNIQKWGKVYLDIKKAQSKLTNYTLNITIRKNEPTYGEITFYHNNLQHFEVLKTFVGEYGFVVPIKGSKESKVLRGEKKMKYVNV